MLDLRSERVLREMMDLRLEWAILEVEMGDLPQGMATSTSWTQIVTLLPEVEIWSLGMKISIPGMATSPWRVLTLLPGTLALPPRLMRFPPGLVAVPLERATS